MLDEAAVPASHANVDIDLGDNNINLSASPDHEHDEAAEALRKPQVLSDDLFFSAISEPTTSENRNNNTSTVTANEDMDEIFTSNRPATKEVQLDDDEDSGPFSTSKLNGAEAAASVAESVAKPSPQSDDTPKLSSFASVTKKAVSEGLV
jgi:hypothetical protein